MTTVHLVRHGEVHNPDGVVYADLDGFDLSDRGVAEAAAAADHLSGRRISVVVASPLLRAQRTATAIAARHGLDVGTDDRLTEWGLSMHWSGLRWAELPAVRPGELEAYLDHPWDLPFSPESISDVAARMTAAVLAAVDGAGSEVVAVSHQDPVQAARLSLTGRPLTSLHDRRPGHAAVITLVRDDQWRETEWWEPAVHNDGSPSMS